MFAQSFHWLEPRRASIKVATILRPGGRLALLSNSVTPMSPTRQDLDEAYRGYLDVSQRPAIDAARDEGLIAMIEECGFTVERRRVVETTSLPTDDWVRMVSTYSNVLALDPKAQVELRFHLEERIGDTGVDAQNDAIALICTTSR